MKLYTISRRLTKWLLTGVAATLAFTTVAQAAQTVTVSTPSGPVTLTMPNSKSVTYNLAAGAVSAPITVPANVPVLVMGDQLGVGFRGVGQVTMLRVPASAPPAFLEWVGLESTAGAAITQGYSSVLGTHILFLDYAHQVDIEVNDATSIRVHNESVGVRSGRVTLIW